MLARRSSLVVVCIGLALLHGCRRQSDPTAGLALTFNVYPHPPRVGQTTIILTLQHSGQRVTGARIRLEGNMSHPGMAPVFADAAEIEPGRYRATIDLSMAGDWYVLVHVTLHDGLKWEQQFEIKAVVADAENKIRTSQEEGLAPALRKKRGQATLPDLFFSSGSFLLL
ncbi:MAG TPA: FixH family protein [Pyrinomonadaceae bacterium]